MPRFRIDDVAAAIGERDSRASAGIAVLPVKEIDDGNQSN